jgi:hypothetical protein
MSRVLKLFFTLVVLFLDSAAAFWRPQHRQLKHDHHEEGGTERKAHPLRKLKRQDKERIVTAAAAVAVAVGSFLWEMHHVELGEAALKAACITVLVGWIATRAVCSWKAERQV